MNTYTKEELTKILEDHRLWLNGDPLGTCANLSGACLRDANLSGANLSGAYLRDAYLRGAYLIGAYLRGAYLIGAYLIDANLRDANLSDANLNRANLSDANLIGADLNRANLSDANLSGANLIGANLIGANLNGANLSDANLSGAYLSDAKFDKKDLNSLVNTRSIIPNSGSFTAFKAVYDLDNREKVIIKLEIQSDSKRVGGVIGRKCRANKAKVVSIPENKLDYVLASGHDETFIYELGRTYEVNDFDDNPLIECAPGIHFFLNPEEAENFTHINW